MVAFTFQILERGNRTQKALSLNGHFDKEEETLSIVDHSVTYLMTRRCCKVIHMQQSSLRSSSKCPFNDKLLCIQLPHSVSLKGNYHEGVLVDRENAPVERLRLRGFRIIGWAQNY